MKHLSRSAALMFCAITLVSSAALAKEGCPDCPCAQEQGKGHHEGPPGGGPGHGKRLFREADINRDGKLTLQEALTAAEKHFTEIDTDKSGNISPEEGQAFRSTKQEAAKKQREARFSRFDKNQDGFVDRDETDMPEPHFERLDDNDDGKLSRDEYLATPEGHDGKGHEKRMKERDANGDGKLSRAEFKDFARSRFTAMDTDKDGVVTRDELKRQRPEHAKKSQ